jgi:hypothetical protein
MDDLTLARRRLRALRLADQTYPSAETAVQGLLGVQAENYRQAAWGVATRANNLTAAGFDRLLDEGRILRTHVLRPTWHFVSPEDIRWLIETTAPRVRRILPQAQRELDVDDAKLEHSAQIIVDSLSGGVMMTRDEIRAVLEENGFGTEGRQLALVLFNAELDALICSGALRDGSQTYALLSERAPDSRSLDRDEALIEMTLRYFTGHGPATERDLAYWATLTVTDVRKALAETDALESLEHEGRTYWFAEPVSGADDVPEPRGHLLQILDEYYRGYQDSRHILDVAGIVPKGRERSLGMALVDGQMVGNVQGTKRSDRVDFEVTPFRSLNDDEEGALREAADRQSSFLGLEARTVFTPAASA